MFEMFSTRRSFLLKLTYFIIATKRKTWKRRSRNKEKRTWKIKNNWIKETKKCLTWIKYD